MRLAKKLLLSFFVIFSFLGWAIHQKTEGSDSGVVKPPANLNLPTLEATINSQAQPGPNVVNSASPSSASSHMSTPPPKGLYKDGSYTGDVVDAYYGNVQVKAIIFGGKITDVQFLQYPNDRQNSIFINTQAMPYLTQEAIAAQSANVDIVSGATATSQAFVQSLQSALAKAKN